MNEGRENEWRRKRRIMNMTGWVLEQRRDIVVTNDEQMLRVFRWSGRREQEWMDDRQRRRRIHEVSYWWKKKWGKKTIILKGHPSQNWNYESNDYTHYNNVIVWIVWIRKKSFLKITSFVKKIVNFLKWTFDFASFYKILWNFLD